MATIVKGLKYADGIGGMESVAELNVEIEGKEYYLLMTDMGDFQKLSIFNTPAIEVYERMIALGNGDFDKAYEEFQAKEILSEEKEITEWYCTGGTEFESAVRLAAMAMEDCPYAEGHEEAAKAFIAEYLDKDIEIIELPETYKEDDDFDE